ncbi:hypothetical protein ScalyP_jg7875 [Parmales sp. scaly parma]|nr:hypothetical protein ScalyP_jg7875 [Parmales sp. scaly parma]|tara:strand:- start:681 stop:1238 length:558 start_codon:yes stop_codon:yes gene_type:complete
MATAEIVADRLNLKETVIGGNGLSRIAVLYRLFVFSCKEAIQMNEFDEVTTAMNNLVIALQLHNNDTQKLMLVEKSSIQELEQCDNEVVSNEREAAVLRTEIAELTKELLVQREIRTNKDELEKGCKLVNEYPSLKSSKMKSIEVKKSLSLLEGKSNEVSDNILLKEKQFQLLLSIITDLKSNLE